MVDRCRLCQQLLEPGVLVLECLQPAGVRHLQPAILGLPLVEGGTADPMLATQVGRPPARNPAPSRSQ